VFTDALRAGHRSIAEEWSASFAHFRFRAGVSFHLVVSFHGLGPELTWAGSKTPQCSSLLRTELCYRFGLAEPQSGDQ
jgi:hypothetical protein